MWLLPREILLAATIVASIIILLVVGYLLTDGKWESLKERENAAIFLAILAILITVNLQVGKIGLKRLVNLLQKSEAASENTVQEYENHTRGIIERLNQLRERQIKQHPALQYTWIYSFLHFPELKDLIYHLYTDPDRRELFDLLLIPAKSGNSLDQAFNARMGEMIRGVIAGGDYLRGCCNSCKRMFPSDEARAFEQQFIEVENSELMTSKLGKIWFRMKA